MFYLSQPIYDNVRVLFYARLPGCQDEIEHFLTCLASSFSFEREVRRDRPCLMLNNNILPTVYPLRNYAKYLLAVPGKGGTLSWAKHQVFTLIFVTPTQSTFP